MTPRPLETYYHVWMSQAMEPKSGRPTKFNEDRAGRLLAAVRAGSYLRVAANHAGISYPTLRRWLLKADDPEAPDEYREFKEAVEKAQADAEIAALARINKAASEGAWQASAWYLERSHPERWGRREKSTVEIIGEGGGPVQVVSGIELTNDAMAALAQRLSRRDDRDDDDVVDAEVVEDETPEQPSLPAAPQEPEPESDLDPEEAQEDSWWSEGGE